MKRRDLPDILYSIIESLGGQASIVKVCKSVWESHKSELGSSGDLFYTWQYDIRWAATELRKNRRMKDAKASPKGIWEII